MVTIWKRHKDLIGKSNKHEAMSRPDMQMILVDRVSSRLGWIGGHMQFYVRMWNEILGEIKPTQPISLSESSVRENTNRTTRIISDRTLLQLPSHPMTRSNAVPSSSSTDFSLFFDLPSPRVPPPTRPSSFS